MQTLNSAVVDEVRPPGRCYAETAASCVTSPKSGLSFNNNNRQKDDTMTNDKWHEIVSYVLGRLENESEFDIDKQRFFENFGLKSSDDVDFLIKRDYPRDRHFQMKTVEFQSHPVFVFSRLELTDPLSPGES